MILLMICGRQRQLIDIWNYLGLFFKTRRVFIHRCCLQLFLIEPRIVHKVGDSPAQSVLRRSY
jgi:hypothetical protein